MKTLELRLEAMVFSSFSGGQRILVAYISRGIALSLFLPGMIATGILLLKSKLCGYLFAAS